MFTVCVALLFAWPVVALAVTYIFAVPLTLQSFDLDALSRVKKLDVTAEVYDANNNILGSGSTSALPAQLGSKTVKVKVTTSSPGKSYRVRALGAPEMGADTQKSTLITTGTLP